MCDECPYVRGQNMDVQKSDMNCLRAFEMKCLQRILNIRWQQENQEQRDLEKNAHKHQHCVENHQEETDFFGHICQMTG